MRVYFALVIDIDPEALENPFADATIAVEASLAVKDMVARLKTVEGVLDC